MADRLYRTRRLSLRMPNNDYCADGATFVTICTQDRTAHFGAVSEARMRLTEAGAVVEALWQRIPDRYASVLLDIFVIMPNHRHGILVRDGQQTGAERSPAHTDGETGGHVGPPLQNPSLSAVLQWFKTATTRAYCDGVHEGRWPAFVGRLWQRSFHDHIIRSQADLNAIRSYIENNPAQWAADNLFTM